MSAKTARKVLRVVPSKERDRAKVVDMFKDLLAKARRGEIVWASVYFELAAGNQYGCFRAGRTDPTTALGALRIHEHEVLHRHFSFEGEP